MPSIIIIKLKGDEITLSGLVASADGTTILKSTMSLPIDQAEQLGTAIAEDLLEQGAAPLLAAATV